MKYKVKGIIKMKNKKLLITMVVTISVLLSLIAIMFILSIAGVDLRSSIRAKN